MPVNTAKLVRILQSPVTRGVAGAGAGAAMGRYVTPKLLGYEDNPAAVNMSTLLDAALFGGLSFMGRKGIGAAMKQHGPMFVPELAGAVAMSELTPVGMNLLTRSTDAAKAVAEKPTAQTQLGNILKLPETRGAGVGAALAALGAVGTGALRARRESERRKDTSRLGMIKNDLMLYAIPAMLAGGVAGHTLSRSKPAAS